MGRVWKGFPGEVQFSWDLRLETRCLEGGPQMGRTWCTGGGERRQRQLKLSERSMANRRGLYATLTNLDFLLEQGEPLDAFNWRKDKITLAFQKGPAG